MITRAQIAEGLRSVEDPELHRSVVDLGMVRDIQVTGTEVTVTLALTIGGCPLLASIPLAPALGTASEAAVPLVISSPQSPAAEGFTRLAGVIARQPPRQSRRLLPILT